jgi:hypothetical protein
MMVGVRSATGTLAGRMQSVCLERAHSNTLWSENRCGPVAWQPPHLRDKELVPPTAGGALRHPLPSHRSPAQTLSDDSLVAGRAKAIDAPSITGRTAGRSGGQFLIVASGERVAFQASGCVVSAALSACSVGGSAALTRPFGSGSPAATSPATSDSFRPDERAARRRWVKASWSSRCSRSIRTPWPARSTLGSQGRHGAGRPGRR